MLYLASPLHGLIQSVNNLAAYDEIFLLPHRGNSKVTSHLDFVCALGGHRILH